MELEPSSKSGASSMLPLGIGLLGLVIGIVALIMSFSNSNKLTPLIGANDTAAAAQKTAGDAKAAADSLVGSVKADSDRITALQNAAQEAFTKQQGDIDGLKTQLASRAAPAGTAKGGTAKTAEANVGPNGGTYVIQQGDLLGKIAVKYGVTVAELQAANPGVDANHLRIGQSITIPPHTAKGSAPRSGAAPTSAPSGSTGPASAVAQ